MPAPSSSAPTKAGRAISSAKQGRRFGPAKPLGVSITGLAARLENRKATVAGQPPEGALPLGGRSGECDLGDTVEVGVDAALEAGQQAGWRRCGHDPIQRQAQGVHAVESPVLQPGQIAEAVQLGFASQVEQDEWPPVNKGGDGAVQGAADEQRGATMAAARSSIPAPVAGGGPAAGPAPGSSHRRKECRPGTGPSR